MKINTGIKKPEVKPQVKEVKAAAVAPAPAPTIAKPSDKPATPTSRDATVSKLGGPDSEIFFTPAELIDVLILWQVRLKEMFYARQKSGEPWITPEEWLGTPNSKQGEINAVYLVGLLKEVREKNKLKVS